MINKQQIEKYITNPGQLSLSTIPELEKLLEFFPYFQTAQLLYVKNLRKEHNIHYNHQLRVAAAYAGDRAFLKRLIDVSEQERAWQPEPEAGRPQEPDTAEVTAKENAEATPQDSASQQEQHVEVPDTASPIQEATETKEKKSQQPEKTQESSPEKAQEVQASSDNKAPEKEVPVSDEGYPYRESEIAGEEQPAGQTPANRRKRELEKLKRELNELRKERQTIEQVIREEEQRKEKQHHKKAAPLPAQEAGKQEDTSEGQEQESAAHSGSGKTGKAAGSFQTRSRHSERRAKSKQELIEKFIREEPSIKRGVGIFYDPTEAARKSIMQSDDIATETLEKLYRKQGKVLQAIKIYEKLSLKFPQKSDYFANQIQELKKTNK